MKKNHILLWVTALALACLSFSKAAAQTKVSIPFLQDEFSVFNFTPASTPNRQFNFTLPVGPGAYPTLAVVAAPTDPANSFLALNPSLTTNQQSANYYTTSIGDWEDLALAQNVQQVGCGNGMPPAYGYAGLALTAYAGMVVLVSDNLQDELANRVIPEFGVSYVNFSYQNVSLNYQIEGGQFDGETIQLHGVMAYGSGLDTNNDPAYGEAWSGQMFLALNWGIDPLSTNYVLMNLVFFASDQTSDSICLPLNDVAQNYFGGETVADYFAPKWQSFMGQVGNGAMNLSGAIPELLYLYDFSGSNTVPPSLTVPSGSLAYNTVLDYTNYAGYTNLYSVINQYDSGFANKLPVRYGRKGGNACGPTALGMDLYTQFVSPVNARSVFDNTTTGGLAAGDNAPNMFSADRASVWLEHLKDWLPQGFSAASPLPAGTLASVRFANGPTATSAQIAATWNDIDRLLTMHFPVVERTDLGVDTKLGPGHMILLLGIGHSDTLAALYAKSGIPGATSLSGDYYIVADPAGHYYGQFSSLHYSYCLDLSYQDGGVNYGGWFAMYPKELLRPRVSRNNGAVYSICGLVIGVPFYGGSHLAADGQSGSVVYTAHSPVVFTVNDPLGRQVGLTTSGEVLQNIPSSYYIPAFCEEEYGTNFIDANGPKTVEVDGPVEGLYTVNLTGTNAGAFEVDWAPFNSQGILSGAATNYGVASASLRTNYVFNLKTGSEPSLQCLPAGSPAQGVALFWPTNSTDYSLQSSPTLSAAQWTTVSGPFYVTNGVYTVTNISAAHAAFYRLSN